MKYTNTDSDFSKMVLVNNQGNIQSFCASFTDVQRNSTPDTEWCLIPKSFEFQAQIMGLKIETSKYA